MNGRIGWMDLTRSMAISMVVLNHAVEYAWPLNALVFSQMSDKAALFRAGIFTMGRLGVPLFLFLSGALLLPRSITSDSGVLQFYRSKLLPLLLTSEVWIVIYNLFMIWRRDMRFSFSSLLRKMLFLEQSDLQHMWYMAMILGIYIAVPFLSYLVQHFTLRSLALPMAAVFCTSFLLVLCNIIRAVEGKSTSASILDLSFLGAQYGFYLLCGYYVARGRVLHRMHRVHLVLLCALFFGLTVWFQVWSWRGGYAYNVWYNFPGLLLCAIPLFELLRRVRLTVRVTDWIARFSLAVFFLHRPIQLLILDRLPPGREILNIIILWAAGMLLSLALSALIRRWKPGARILFLIKD